MIIANLEGLFLRDLVHNLSTVADVIFGCRFVAGFLLTPLFTKPKYLLVGEPAII